MTDAPFWKAAPERVTFPAVPSRLVKGHEPHPLDEIRGLVRDAAVAASSDSPADPLGDLHAAIAKMTAQIRAEEDARARAAADAIERFRDAWRAAEGRPPHIPAPDRRDRSQRARWLRRRARDERARDLHDMQQRLIMSVTPITFTTDEWDRDYFRWSAYQYVGFGIRSSTGLINIPGI